MELLKPGQIFAQRYRVERYLAQGGMGAVFVSQQLATDQAVALKVLWPGILSSAKALSQFELEAKVAGRVRSENIVRVLDAGQDGETGFPFLVMELLEGKTLQAIVEKQGALGAAEVIEYLSQTARGLDKAHSYVGPDGAVRPVVHRDLKPENLFRTQRDTGEPLIKILDFGIAKSLSDSAGVSQEVRGTPLYMAYEQAAGEAITPQTDIWALGLIAFFLLNGHCYWKAATNPQAGIGALFTEILTSPKPPASERSLALSGRSLGPAFDAWLGRCLAHRPSERFATASEAVHALAGALKTTSATVALPSPPPVASAPVHVQPLPASVAGSTADKLAVARTGRHEKQSSGMLVPLVAGAGVVVGAIYGVVAFVGSNQQQPAPLSTGSPPSAPPSAPTTANVVSPASAPVTSPHPVPLSSIASVPVTTPSAAPARRPPPQPVGSSSKPPPISTKTRGTAGSAASDFTPDGFFRNP